jgi:two-component system, chemotaxis family, protein-glutamate methylesterase/glutaminase
LSAALPTSKISKNLRGQSVRVMLVDDSEVARSIISRILSRSKEVEIIFEAPDADSALDALADVEVDIILLDIEMPNRTGLDALPDLLERSSGARVIVVSSFVEENGPSAIEALSLGASDTLAKPGRSGFSGSFSQLLLEKVLFLAQSQTQKIQMAERVAPYSGLCAMEQLDCVAIGASTGGIPAIFEIISTLDPQFDCPILITQHLPVAFMSFFARQLERLTDRHVVVAGHNMPIEKNYIYIASGLSHLCCKQIGAQIFLEAMAEYAGSKYCPSVDAMLESVAAVYGEKSLSIILSGMGQDGLIGARKLAAIKGNIVVQDASSSVVWGMPGAIVRENLASAILSPTDISKLLNSMAERG